MPNLDLDDLLDGITTTMSDILQTDVKLLRGYSKTKAKTIARFTQLIADGYTKGEISESELEDELDELDMMVERFVRNLRALANTTVERLIKGVTTVLYGAIKGAATGAGIPLPAIDIADD